MSYITQHVQAPAPSSIMQISLMSTTNMASITLRRPHSDCLPPCDVSYLTLMQALSIDNLMTAFALVLREQQVLVISEFHQAYSSVTEALVSLIFPLAWEFPFISVAPVQLIGVLESPVPFIVGLHTRVCWRVVTACGSQGCTALHCRLTVASPPLLAGIATYAAGRGHDSRSRHQLIVHCWQDRDTVVEKPPPLG